MILIVVLYAFLASTFIFAKKAIMYSAPCFLIGFRMTLAGLILLGYHRFRMKKIIIHKSDKWLFAKVAFFHIYIAFVFEFWALQYLSVLKTTMIYSLTPFIAALLSYFLLSERLTVIKIIGITFGLSGIIPIVMTVACESSALVEMFSISFAEIILLIAVTSASYAWFLVKKLMDRGYNLDLINGFAMFFGGILSLCTSIMFENLYPPVTEWYPFLGWILALIVVANFVVYNLYGWLLKKHSITLITVAGFLTPAFATMYEYFFMDGKITWHYGASLILVTLGLIIFCWQDLVKRFK